MPILSKKDLEDIYREEEYNMPGIQRLTRLSIAIVIAIIILIIIF